MAQYNLQAAARTEKGKSYRKELMNKGWVPGIVYGKNMESQSVELEWRPLHDVLSKGGQNAIINMNVKNDGEHKVMIKELQYDSITKFLIHVDFKQISMHDKVQVVVPIHQQGEIQDGILQVVMRELNVSCLPGKIPESFVVDISSLTIGDSVTVADLDIPDGVDVENAPDETVLTITSEDKEPTGAEEPEDNEEDSSEETAPEE
ncbi:MAG: 50S ribosomal protein L25 [Clostridiales bacterium]|nr:50S ribosomal protein L25 [Clostridiales bacterium]MCF8021569.1 50S ribosomal protein L25 [Clostridiales bacterium]